ncbi:MAG: gliding motility-associated C-terminal domain-containing protein, partial [Flavobacteriales bacterium]|nr:gliding motility-associated C-terminal domain-containing protein [Flavobacteriales bacterium]
VQSITVIADVNPAWTNPGTICETAGTINLNTLITGTTGGNWTGTGVSGTNFDPSFGSQSVTYTVGTAPCQEVSVQTITVAPDVFPTWTNPGTICAAAGSINLSALITGTTGGTWSGTGVSGTSFNPASGTQSVTYTVGIAPCQETSVQSITVIPDPDPTWTNPGPLCEASGNTDLSTFVTGTTGGTWAGTGVTGSLFNPTGLSGSINITYTVGGAPCAENLMLSIVINQEDDASFNFPSGATHCVSGVDPTATITGITGGTFSISPAGTIDPSTGAINLSATGIGTYTITYNTASAGNPCPQSSTASITITTSPGATFTYGASQYCQNDANPVISYSPGASGGAFSVSPSGLNLIPVTGAIDLLTSTAGTYTIYNFIAAASGCISALDSIQIVIHPMYNVPLSASVCQGDSILIAGGFRSTPGTYLDTLISSFGCDSVISTTLTILPVYLTPLTASICQGDSILLGGNWQNAFGTYLDTLVSISGCDSILSTSLTIIPLNTIAVSAAAPICLGDPVILSATGSGAGIVSWYSDAGGSTILGTGNSFSPTITASGTYTYYVNEAGTCPSNIDSVSIDVQEVSAVFSTTTSSVVTPVDVTITNGSTTGSGITYSWTFGDGDSSSIFEPSHTYTNEGIYDIILFVSDGLCTDSTMVTINANGQSHLNIPNVFTPNGDGNNDIFFVDASNMASITGEIYNRWGQLIFSWYHVNGGWNGRSTAGELSSEGTYYYVIQASGDDGQEYLEKGSVTLIR